MREQDDDKRKITCWIYPGKEESDRQLAEMLDGTRLKERGRVMRSLMLAGMALSVVDRRLPYMLAELSEGEMTVEGVQHLIRSVAPEKTVTMDNDVLFRQFITHLTSGQLTQTDVPTEVPEIPEPEPLSEEKKAIEETKANSRGMFPD